MNGVGMKAATNAGLVILIFGLVLALVSCLFNLVTSADGGGANIGAGIGFILGLALTVVGVLCIGGSAIASKARRK